MKGNLLLMDQMTKNACLEYETIAFFQMDGISKNILKCLNYIMVNLGDSAFNNTTDVTESINLSFFQKKSDKYKILKELSKILNDSFTENKNIKKIDSKSFFNMLKTYPQRSRIVIILKVDINEEYISQFQYTLLLVNYLISKNTNVNIIIVPKNAKPSGYRSNPYDPDFFRLRVALKLLYMQNFDEMNDIFLFSNPVNEFRIKKFYTSYPDIESNRDTGSIFPIININREQYNALCCNCKLYDENSTVLDELENSLFIWCRTEVQKFEKEVDREFKNRIIEFTKQDNYLDTIIFLYTCYAIVKEGTYRYTNKIFEIKERILNNTQLTILHEICVDFSQCILQLIENIILHVIKEPNNCGCGTLSLRLRKGHNNKFNMYIYVNDLQYNTFSGIVEMFIKNNPQFTTSNGLTLSNFFDRKNSSLEKYLKSTNQIAMHYGLQILDCIVKERYGRLYVSSGTDSYLNDDITESLSYCGTAYEIEFPIKPVQLSVSFSDTVFPIHESKVFDYANTITIDFYEDQSQRLCVAKSGIEFKPESNNKETLIYDIKGYIKSVIDATSNIECAVINLLHITDVRVYEIIAKSIFLYLCEKQSINYFAIVNLSSQHDVVKIFRQFALFFNRQGRAPLNNRNVFIIDKNGNSDVLISGELLIDINKMSSYERVFGGINSRMETILQIISRNSERES